MCSVYLGYIQEIKRSHIIKFLNQHDVSPILFESPMDNMQVLKIATHNMKARSLLCFGKRLELSRGEGIDLVADKTVRYTQGELEFKRKILARNRIWIMEDSRFWISFIRQFIQAFNRLNLIYTYEERGDWSKSLSISVNEITSDFLLDLEAEVMVDIK